MKPTRPAAATQPRCSIGTGLMSRRIASIAGDDRRQGDHRDHEQSGEVFGAAVAVGVAPGRGLAVPSANAIHSGIAVSASEKLWMVSASQARPIRDQADDHQLDRSR